ncbi:MAG: hypothetical protein K5989_08655 [Lachnospiraceae bacterium]|nr:hypothetical protein [Lachnospiraceae bacterium]
MNFTETLVAWEGRQNIFRKGRLHGFDFYSYIRRDFVNNLLSLVSGEERDYFEDPKEEEGRVKRFFRLWKRSEKTSSRDVDLLILCHPRRVMEDGKYICPYTDYLTDLYPNSLVLERARTPDHLEPAYSRNMAYLDRMTDISYVYNVLFQKLFPGKYRALIQEVKEIMDEPFDDLEKTFRIQIGRQALYERIVTLYCYRRSMKPALARFLKKVRPRVIVEVVGKSFEARLLNETAKDLRIPTVELQHSIMTPNAVYPKGVKEKQFADFALTYSQYWNEFARLPIPKSRVIAVGQNRFEEQVKKYRTLVHRDPNHRKVVFISGLVYGRPLSLLALEFSRIAAEHGIDVIYKLHPIEFPNWREMYPELAASGLTVLDTLDKGIYDVFAECDAQVGVKSTAIYEGLGFGLSTFIMRHPLGEEAMRLCDKGFAKPIDRAEELLEGILHMDSGDKAREIADYFWKPHAADNTKAVLDRIIARRRG